MPRPSRLRPVLSLAVAVGPVAARLRAAPGGVLCGTVYEAVPQ